jgi:hypothetical protein
MTATLTDLLRDRTDQELAALFRLRPDLIVPVPGDLSVVATRAQARGSVVRALEALSRFQLEILDAVRLTCDVDRVTSLDRLLAATAATGGADAATVRAAVQRLAAYLLVYGTNDALQVVAAVDEVLGPHPAGLGRPATDLSPASATLVADPAPLRRAVLSAPPHARAVLERLATAGPVGTVTGGPPHGERIDRAGDGTGPVGGEPGPDGTGPVEWLVQHRLLVRTSANTVELPREVGMLLRRDKPLGALHPAPPVPAAAPTDPAAVDAAGAGQAMDAVRHTEALLETLAAAPAPVLRTGGVGIRDLRRLARAAGVADAVAALLIEAAYAAGLASEAETGSRAGSGQELLPAAGYDRWRTAPLASRWRTLAAGWLAMTRAPGLVGGRDFRGRPVGVLSAAAERGGAPALRRTTLGILAGLPAGTAPTAAEALVLLAWHAPRRTAGQESAVRDLLAEAAHLGVTGRGAITSYGAALLVELTRPAAGEADPLGTGADDPGAAAGEAEAILDDLLPDPVDELLVQTDLTVVVPGPPEPVLNAELELVADLESAGGASVHRVTRHSIRRALDAGYAAGDLHALFARRSRTPVPQALTYLIDDVCRAHGGLRVGSAGSYLRSDDEGLLAQVLADRRLAALGLRRLAPAVLMSAASSGRLLAALRDADYIPVPEDSSGTAVLTRPRGRRAAARAPATLPTDPLSAPRMATPRLLGIVEDIRRGDAIARAARRIPGAGHHHGRVPGASAAQAHAEAMAVLQQAVRDRATVLVGYVDSHGSVTSRLLRPVSIGAGYLRAENVTADTLHTVALHRITGATREAAGADG